MPQITDVSPTSPANKNQSVTGRMLSIACSPDALTVYAGSYSNLWVSRDGGQNFTQVAWPQPSADQTSVPGSLGGWCAVDVAMGMDSSNQLIVLALMCFDRANIISQDPVTVKEDRGIWRSPDGGVTWTQVHQFTPTPNVGQLEWAQGSDHLVYAAGGSSLAISQDAGATFVDVFPFGKGATKQVNHVAVWQNAPADSAPEVIYALGSGCMAVSFDGGTTWTQDQAVVPTTVGGATSAVANSNAAKVMAIDRKSVV